MKRSLPIVLFTALFFISGCCHNGDNSSNPVLPGSATVSVVCGPVGSLHKEMAISLQKLYVTLSASDESDINDTFALSGYGQQTVTKNYLNLAANKTWTITAFSKDANGTTIHSGSDTFSIQTGVNTLVNLNLNALYSMLKVSFLPVMDSITACEVEVDDSTVLDSSFTKQSLVGKTVTLVYNYLSAGMTPGIAHELTLNAYGDADGVNMLLYTGSINVNIISGVDSSYSIELKWVGPNKANAAIIVGNAAVTSLYGRFEDHSTYNSGMVKIPAAGYFLAGQLGIDNAEPVHRVEFTHDFWIDTTEITQRDYSAVMGINPSLFTGDLNKPVENVTWYDAVLYCNSRSKRDGLDTVYRYTSVTGAPGNGCTALGGFTADLTKKGYRLPTEAEWEFAARAGTTTSFYFDSLSSNFNAWYSTNSADATHPVAQKLPNAYGLYDMSGNVWEWCHDWYNLYSNISLTDPTGPSSGTSRAYRGGAWNSTAALIRTANRGKVGPNYRYNYLGFRTVSLQPLIHK